MRLLLMCFCVWLVTVWPATGAAGEAAYGGLDSHCEKLRRVDLREYFVTCNDKGSNSNFGSVVIAIHGWGGDCRSTFGEGGKTLFAALAKHRHYDIDCFNYESTKWDIAKSVAELRKRITYLHGRDYKNFAFVTHSMGGVVLLRLLTEDFLADDGISFRPAGDPKRLFKPGGPVLTRASIWASPINGVRPHITAATEIARFLSWLEENTVEEISSSSPALKRLRADLEHLGIAIHGPDAAADNIQQIKLTFYHGQDHDAVVEPIEDAPQWLLSLGANWADLVPTEEGHLSIFGNATTDAIPRYPSQIIKMEGLLSLPFTVRRDAVFPLAAIAPDGFETRQLRVVDGTISFISENNVFDGARKELSLLFQRYVQPRPVRFDSVDKEFTGELLRSVKRKAQGLVDEGDKRGFLELAGTFICGGTPEGFDVRSADAASLGQGAATAGKTLLEFYEKLITTAREIVTAEPMLETFLVGCPTLPAAELKLLAIYEHAKFSNHRSHRETAFRGIESFVENADVGAVARSGVVEQLGTYLQSGGATEDLAKQIAGTLEKASQRSAALQAQVAQAVIGSLPDGQPIYARGFSRVQLERLSLNAQKNIAFPANREFLQRTWVSAGAKGTDTNMIRDNFGALVERAQITSDALERERIIQGLNPDLVRRNYSGVAQELDIMVRQLQ